MTITFFPTGEAFRTWLEEHHGTARELVLGFHKTSSKTRVMSAKRQETRDKRARTLIEDSANARRIAPLSYGKGRT